MNTPQVSPSEIERHINEALAVNVLRMFYVYPILYFVLGVQSGFLEGHWSWYWATLLLLSLFSGLRFWHGKQLNRWSAAVWRRGFACLSFLQVLVWSLQVAYIILQVGMVVTTSLWLIVTAGIASGGVSSMSPSRPQALTFACLTFLPIVLALLWVKTPDALVFVVCLIVFLVHLVTIAWQQSALYRTALLDHLGPQVYTEALEKAGRKDALTELFNRGYFNQQSKAEWRRSARNGQSLALLLLDIDHFKSINDRYGHLVGDRCLRLAAALLHDFVRRPSDLAARFGGEEFVLLLPETEISGAQKVAEGIVSAFAQRNKLAGSVLESFADIEHIEFTVSIGVVACEPVQGGTLERLLDCADQAMYQAKAGGRNQVCVVDEQQLKQALTAKVQ